MPFSTEGDRVSYTLCIFHKERKSSHQLIWSKIPLPRTFLHAIFHRVSYTFYIFHIERKYEQLYHCSFSIPSKSLKKKRWILSLSHFFFLSFAEFFIVSFTKHQAVENGDRLTASGRGWRLWLQEIDFILRGLSGTPKEFLARHLVT